MIKNSKNIYSTIPFIVFAMFIALMTYALNKPLTDTQSTRNIDIAKWRYIHQQSTCKNAQTTVIQVFADWCLICKENLALLKKYNIISQGFLYDEDGFALDEYKSSYCAIAAPKDKEALLRLGHANVPHIFVIHENGDVLASFKGAISIDDAINIKSIISKESK